MAEQQVLGTLLPPSASARWRARPFWHDDPCRRCAQAVAPTGPPSAWTKRGRRFGQRRTNVGVHVEIRHGKRPADGDTVRLIYDHAHIDEATAPTPGAT